MRVLIAALTVSLLWHGTPQAQEYPSRTITIVVPFGPGSATDTQARIIAAGLQQKYGQPVIVENKGGADGAIAAEYVSRAAPDGYTLMTLTNGLFGIEPLSGRQPFNLLDDTPITGIARNTQLLVVRPDLPIRSVADLIAYAKKHPNTLSLGTGNTSGRISDAVLEAATGISRKQIPYKNSEVQTLNDLLGGHIDAAFLLTAVCLGQVRSGGLIPLAVMDSVRFAGLPDVPAITEILPELSTLALIAPRGTLAGPPGLPADIAALLSRDVQAILREPQVVAKFRNLGSEPDPMSPEELADYWRQQSVLWPKVVRERGLARAQ